MQNNNNNIIKEYISNGEEDTIKIAKEFAATLSKSDIVVLTGDLGAGKTKFMYGIASYFNVLEKVCSPTFTIVNEYTLPKKTQDISTIFHFDVYRLKDSVDFLNSIGDEYFSNGLCVIEWGENIQDILPPDTLHVYFEKLQDNTRKITICKGEE